MIITDHIAIRSGKLDWKMSDLFFSTDKLKFFTFDGGNHIIKIIQHVNHFSGAKVDVSQRNQYRGQGV